MYIREALYNLITTWNDQSSVLGATVRAMMKGDDQSSTPEVFKLSPKQNSVVARDFSRED